MSDLERTVADLARRLQAVEDELAIHKVILRYGPAVDGGDADAAAAVFTEEGIYDVDVGRMEGRAAIGAMIRGPRHQAMVGHCAHQMGPFVVSVDGDRAEAVGYSRVYLETPAGTHVYRVSFNRWVLGRRPDGTWLIERRLTRKLGHAEACGVLRGT